MMEPHVFMYFKFKVVLQLSWNYLRESDKDQNVMAR